MNKNSTKENSDLKRLLQFAFTKKALIITSGVLSFLSAAASFIPFIVIYNVIRIILQTYPNFQSLNGGALVNYGWIAFLGILLNIVLYFFSLMCSHLAAFGTLYELKLDFADHIAKIPLGFHLRNGSGKTRKIMDENIEKIEGFIAHQFPDIVGAVTAPILMIVILFSFDWRFGLATLIAVIAAFYFQTCGYGKDGMKVMTDRYQYKLEDLNNATVEYVRGISVIKAFKQTVKSFRSLNDTIKSYTDFVIEYTLSWEKTMSLYYTLINNIYLFIVPVGIMIGINTKDYRDFTLKFIFYLIFVPSISGTLAKAMYATTGMVQISSGVRSMDKIFSVKKMFNSSSDVQVQNHDIQFEGVTFKYNEDDSNAAIKDISFTAKEGEITALVGPSGGGKSTIAHLISRFYDVTKGEISLGGISLKDIHQEKLMEMLSFVFQDVFLFKQSIKDNIKLGDVGASDEDIIRAAKSARCHEFIENLPQGYETIFGSEGTYLSSGEKQRIAIARAILKNSPVIVLDEATAYSDPENEHLIQQGLSELIKNKTVIIIAHRLSTIKKANKIIVLEEGNIVEQGSHETLLKREGKYASMWNMFTQSLKWKIKKVKGEAANV